MRQLKTRDAGKMSKILSLMGIKLSGETETEVGMSFIVQMGENYHKAEKEIAEFMASLIGNDMTADKFLDLEIDETLKYFDEFKSLKGIDSFFKLVGQIK